ncbi:transposase [Azospira restricta]|uniref:Transposase n=1 Tax=Azospira restricta TaxID=404405 RepID=A0A974SNP3_9RHOO|nr:transposase [Azospira restricta]
MCSAHREAKGNQKNQPLVHHSNRGIQYCANEYPAIHRRRALVCSIPDAYDCYQNAPAERINGILKHEFRLQQPDDLHRARRMISQSVAIYNNPERPHLSLQAKKAPYEVHRASLQACNNVGLSVSTGVNLGRDGSLARHDGDLYFIRGADHRSVLAGEGAWLRIRFP